MALNIYVVRQLDILVSKKQYSYPEVMLISVSSKLISVTSEASLVQEVAGYIYRSSLPLVGLLVEGNHCVVFKCSKKTKEVLYPEEKPVQSFNLPYMY